MELVKQATAFAYCATGVVMASLFMATVCMLPLIIAVAVVALLIAG